MSKMGFMRAAGVALLALAGAVSAAQAQVTFATGRQGGSQYPVSELYRRS